MANSALFWVLKLVVLVQEFFHRDLVVGQVLLVRLDVDVRIAFAHHLHVHGSDLVDVETVFLCLGLLRGDRNHLVVSLVVAVSLSLVWNLILFISRVGVSNTVSALFVPSCQNVCRGLLGFGWRFTESCLLLRRLVALIVD